MITLRPSLCLALASLAGAPLHADPLENWTFSRGPGITASRTSDGVIRLIDDSAADTPRATFRFPEPVASGELRWRSRHAAGRGTLVNTLRLHTADARSWEISAFNSAVWLKNTGDRGSSAYAPAGADWLDLGRWADFRLVFDTNAGRAQLYLNDLPSPVAGIDGLPGPVERITLAAGHDVAVGNAAEFSALSFERGPIAFKEVKRLAQPRPARQQKSDDWPELRPAPAEWTVRDKYDQFAAWWPGQPGDAAAREALRRMMHRETLGLGNEFTAALRLLPVVANSIRWEPPLAGAQQSHLYRSSPGSWTTWDRPSNARLMECVTLLARFYAIDQPWNPYHRDPALGRRLGESLEYWLSLQCEEGGFPEYAGFGSNELPSTAFNLMSMAEVYAMLKDEPLFARLAPRWLDSMQRAVLWGAIPDSPQRRQGISHANQYLGIIAGAWHLHAFTGEVRWKTIYDQLTDWWLAEAQSKAGWYREGGGREDFAYSLVSDLYGDRLALETGDPRWIESLRRAMLATQLIVVYEMDLKTAVMDVTGHARTTPLASLNFLRAKEGSVTNPWQTSRPRQRYLGWFNHMASLVPEARAFAFGSLTTEEASALEQRYFDAWPASLSWLNPTPHVRGAQRGAYGWDESGAYWPLPAGAQAEAAAQTLPWRETRFTDVSIDGHDQQELACVRRPGYYTTFRSGRANGRQTLGLGLVWMPGFGTVLASANAAPRPAFGWRATGQELGKEVRSLQMAWEGASPDTASHLTLTNRDLPAFRFGLGEEALTIRAEGAPLYLPLVSRDGEIWTLSDGSTWTGRDPAATSTLRLRRIGEKVTHDALIDFGRPVRLEASAPADVGADLSVRSVAVTPSKAGVLEIVLRRVAR